MSDFLSLLSAGTEVLSLTSELSKLLEENLENAQTENVGLATILYRLKGEAISISEEFPKQLREMIEGFKEDNVDIDRSFKSLLEDLHWYNFLSRNRLKAQRERFYAMHRQLTTFLDDATALMLCKGEGKRGSSAFRQGLEVKNRLDRLMLEDPSIREIFGQMITIADNL